MRTAFFIAGISVLLAVLVYAAMRSYLRTRAAEATSLEDLVRRLRRLDRERIAQIAAGALELSGLDPEAEYELDPEDLWEWTGGLAGLRNLGWNCEVLIELACHVQRRYPEAVVVAEQLRLNAREIQWHIARLQGAEQAGHLQAVFPDYAERAVTIYYTMTRDLLELFAEADLPGFSVLQGVI